MMNRIQLLLGKLAEEALEVGQIALKAQQFGLREVCPGQLLSNKQRVHVELDHLMAQIEMLNDECDFGYNPDRERMQAKKVAVNKYAKLSASLGQVSWPATKIYPVANFAQESTFAMEVLQQMAGIELSTDQLCLATKMALTKADKGEEITVAALVELWAAEPALGQFAHALQLIDLRGAYEKHVN